MTAYCTTDNLGEFVLSAYLDAAEKLRAGAVASHIAQVSAEIDEALAPLYRTPLAPVPATVKRICAVMAAYRVVGGVTTLVTEGGTTKDEWIPLQAAVKQAQIDLDAMRKGTSGYGLDGYERTDQSVIVRADRPIFGDRFWREHY